MCDVRSGTQDRTCQAPAKNAASHMSRKVGPMPKSYAWVKPGVWGAVIAAVAITILGFWSFSPTT